MYLNTSTYNVYSATAANSWVYKCNIKGANGSNGSNGSKGDTGDIGYYIKATVDRQNFTEAN